MTIYTDSENSKSWIPYTYLIGWSWLDTWYYGVEFSNSKEKIANPANLWTIYRTSSEHVVRFIEKHGGPDVIQVRHTFSTIETACNWESNVIRRIGMVHDPRFLNKHDPRGTFYQKGPRSEKTKKKIQKAIQARVSAGIHNLQKRSDGSSVGKDSMQSRIEAKTFVSPLLKRSDGSSVAGDSMQARIESKTFVNPFQNPVKKECPHCLGWFNPGPYMKWHGDRCKMNPISTYEVIKIICKFCGLSFSKSLHTRWHGEKCKMNTGCVDQ